MSAAYPLKRVTKRLAVCLENDGNESSLIPGQIYQVVPDERAAKDGPCADHR